MAYSRTIWVNDSLPAINSENLNKIENGIAESNIFRNLFNKNNIVNGWLNYSNNVLMDTTSTTFMTSGYIEVKPNTQYTINLVDATSLSSGGIMQYDSNFNWIQPGIPETQVVMTFTTTSTTKYVRFVLRNDAKDNIQFEENTEATEYTPFAGYIVESGSNDNGSWIKYSDGSMICYGNKDVTLDCSQTWGNLFVGRYENYISFPQEFIDIPLLQIHTRSTTNASSWLISYDKTTVSKSNFYEVDIARATANNSVPITITFIAIGKWK